MGMLKPYCIQIAIALLFLAQTNSSIIEATAQTNATAASCIASERSALLTLRASLSDPKNRLSSWEGDDCCQWNGVRCSNQTGHVIKLDLSAACVDDFSVSIKLVLEGSTNISSSLFVLHHLKFLDLRCNSFIGRIPPQLGNLSNLSYLNLDYVTGNTMDIAWLSQLSSLKYLSMTSVNLSVVASWVSVVNRLPSLKYLCLSGCHLSTNPDSLLNLNLTSLETLDISHNSFNKHITPNWFWDLTSLKGLDISRNRFYGPFPYELGNMTSIVNLSLSDNNLVGMIPCNMNNLCNLELLELGENNINGSITELFQRLPSCSQNKLEELSIYFNNLTGRLPSKLTGPLSNLTVLFLSGNQLRGPVPLWIGELSRLYLLDLGFNDLNGPMHEAHFRGLDNLKTLILTGNSIAIIVNSSWVPPFNLEVIELSSCKIGPKFPAWLRWQKDLGVLNISNTSISDMLPDWFWDVASSVPYLNMCDNQIKGVLPPSMEFMHFIVLNLRSNQFYGQVPKLPVNLTDLDLSRNNMSGPLPLDFGALDLETLVLSDNSISGSLPSSLCNLRSLMLLDLSGNELSGPCPNCSSSTTNTTSLGLINLSLGNNNISGEFPWFIQYSQELIILDLAFNQFYGTLPSWIGEKLQSLAFLILRYNMFSGHIPGELANLFYLQYLDLAHNNLSGSIPKSIVNCTGMTQTENSDKLEGAIVSTVFMSSSDAMEHTDNVIAVTKGQERLYTTEIIYMVNLDLSFNNLSGEIPEDICTLVALKNLNLSWNAFSGKIPAKIGALVQVESVDLSHNELSGEIPTNLAALTSLSHLNLSYNNLIGKVPSGNQLRVLGDQASIYIGNPGLCGPPLTGQEMS